MDSAEMLAQWTLKRLLPGEPDLVPVEVQSNNEHDFDVYNNCGVKIAIVEVTAAIHQASKLSHERQKRRGPICSDLLNYDWILDAHNPDPKRVSNEGVNLLKVLEENNLSSFSEGTCFFENSKVAAAVTHLVDVGIHGGSSIEGTGNIHLLTSMGENRECYTQSSEYVTDILFDALKLDDNAKKLSIVKHGHSVDRHFFVEIDEHTNPAAGYNMWKVEPPSEKPALCNLATHIWAAIRPRGDLDEVVVWCGTADGWERRALNADHELKVPTD